MASIWEKAVSILAGNLNSGLSYLITTVELYTNFILTLSGKVPSPICGQTVILAEKCEENTYTLIEPSIDQQNISPVKNGRKQPKDIESESQNHFVAGLYVIIKNAFIFNFLTR